MRAALAALMLLAAARTAAADPLPPGSIGGLAGMGSGTGADAKRLGFGYLLGAQAAWQPMDTNQRMGWSAKWSIVFGTMYDADAARINSELLTLDMDLLVGIRVRPGVDPSRYVTLRGGGILLRTDQVIPDKMSRVFVGGIASIGVDQYVSGLLISVDLRYQMIGTGPASLGLMLGVAKTGP